MSGTDVTVEHWESLEFANEGRDVVIESDHLWNDYESMEDSFLFGEEQSISDGSQLASQSSEASLQLVQDIFVL